jgi:hypothetical protein
MANPGQDQAGRWKAALAANNRQKHSRRGRRKLDASDFRITGPGMIRVMPADRIRDGGDGGDGGDGHPPAA